MTIKKPLVTCLNESHATSPLRHLADCASICYASIPKSSSRMSENLWNKGHKSMFRHVSKYYIIPINKVAIHIKNEWKGCPYIDFVTVEDNEYYVSTNLQYVKEHQPIFEDFEEYEIDVLTAFNNPIFYQCKLLRYTFIVETGIDITRELNRTSPNAIAEQSTRYVDFNKKIGIRFKKCHWMNNLNLYRKLLVKFMCKVDEWFYKISRSKYGLNLKPQDARWCLFLDTMSKVAYTYSVKEWEHILELRYAGTTGIPHPDAMIVAKEIYTYLTEEKGYKLSF